MKAQNFLPQLGLSFSDLRATWSQYAPTIQSDLKTVRTGVNEILPAAPQKTTIPTSQFPSSAPAPAPAPVIGPTNMAPAPAFQKSNAPAMIAGLIGVGLLGGGGYYLWKSGFFKKLGRK
jgi:hypothetical protein